MSLEVLKRGDGRRRGLVHDWNRWLRHADALYNRFFDQVNESPFYFHEVASTGFLASAAAMAGFVPLAEYEIIKRKQADRRIKVDGRADLWFSTADRAYSFELKRARLAVTPGNLRAGLKAASKDVACIQRDEYHYAAGLLIARVGNTARESIYKEFAETDEVDLAYRIGPAGENGAYLFFNLSS